MVYLHPLLPCFKIFLKCFLCSRLAFLFGEGTSSQPATSTTNVQEATASQAKKTTPKKKRQKEPRQKNYSKEEAVSSTTIKCTNVSVYFPCIELVLMYTDGQVYLVLVWSVSRGKFIL
jgi:hypothetical protein